MERLEAALAKARAARQDSLAKGEGRAPILSDLQQQQPQPRPGHSLPVTPSADWGSLKPITLTRRTINRGRLSALEGGRAATPYDMLRARLLRQMKEKGWHRLGVTSPDAGCGKTTISLNLAFSLARQADLRVLLMDFDLRHPSIAKTLRQTSRDNIADLLQGNIPFGDFAMRHGTNLAICMNQRPVPQSAELLQSRKSMEMLNHIITEWAPDIVLFDLPPLQGNDDTLGFLEQLDGVLLVAAAESTTISQIDICERELSGLTNVVGTVLNKCRYPDAEAGYGGGYYY